MSDWLFQTHSSSDTLADAPFPLIDQALETHLLDTPATPTTFESSRHELLQDELLFAETIPTSLTANEIALLLDMESDNLVTANYDTGDSQNPHPSDPGGGGGENPPYPGIDTAPGIEPNGLGEFDYSTIFPPVSLVDWQEWLSGSGDIGYTSQGYESLGVPDIHEWVIDLDPELLDPSLWKGIAAEQITTYFRQDGAANMLGLTGPDGKITPIYREWIEIKTINGETQNGPIDLNAVVDLGMLEITRHKEFLGYVTNQNFQVSSNGMETARQLFDRFQSLTGAGFRAMLDGVNTVADVNDIIQALVKFGKGGPNTQAMGTPSISSTNGSLQSPVMSADRSQVIGYVSLWDGGYTVQDINGYVIESKPSLPQHWNDERGIDFKESLAHQERTSGIFLAQALVGMVGLAIPPVFKAWAADATFGVVSGALENGAWAGIEFRARAQEAAYELRAYQLRTRGY